jgi:hypothetical protein
MTVASVSSLFFLRLLVMSLILLRVPRVFSWLLLVPPLRLEMDDVLVSGPRVPGRVEEEGLLTKLVRLADRPALLANRSNTLLVEPPPPLRGRLLPRGSRIEAVLANRSMRELLRFVMVSACLRSLSARWPGLRFPVVIAPEVAAIGRSSSTLIIGTDVT